MDAAGGVIGFGFEGVAQDQDRNPGEAGVEFGDELGTADAGHMEAGDDEAQIAGKLRLFNKAECFGCIANALHVMEPPLEEGFTQERLEWIVVHQQDCGHGVLNSARAQRQPARI